jgi:choline dehydrogenase-like flavoprotein
MQSWYVDEWSDRGLFLEATFTPLAFGAHWLGAAGHELVEWVARYSKLAVIGVHRSDHSEGRVTVDRRGRARVRYRLEEEDAAAIRYGIARAADLHFAAGARRSYPQLAGVPSIEPGGTSRVEDGRFSPADLRLEAFHPMGTARMAGDPRRSVVSPTGETHDVPGLWIADASLFPTSLGVNPMITILACARQVAGQLASRL